MKKPPAKVWILFKEQLTGSATKKVPDATQLNINNFIKMVWGPNRDPISVCAGMKTIINGEAVAAADLASALKKVEEMSSDWEQK